MMRTLAIIALLIASPILRAELPSSINKLEQVYELCAHERITKGIFFDIVDVGIYYPDCSGPKHIFDDQDKLLRFQYLRDVDGEQFTEGAEEYLTENLSSKEKALCTDSFSELNKSYKDVSEGDYYDLYLLAKSGLKLYLNDDFIINMSNTDCDSIYLNVWFGEESIDSQFSDLQQKLEHQEP